MAGNPVSTSSLHAAWTARRWPWAVAVLGLALWPAVPILRGDSTVLADPLKYVLHHTGFAASLVLLATLALTPLRRLGREQAWARGLVRQRRFLGLSAAFLALAHLGVHVLYEGGVGVLVDNVRKPFLAAGMAAFVVLAALAFTSTDGWIRRLGRRWKTLHRAVWVAAILVAYHQVAAHKLFPREILWWYVPWLALQLTRFRKTSPSPAT